MNDIVDYNNFINIIEDDIHTINNYENNVIISYGPGVPDIKIIKLDNLKQLNYYWYILFIWPEIKQKKKKLPNIMKLLF